MTSIPYILAVMMLIVYSTFATKSLTLKLSGPNTVGSLSDLVIVANMTNTGDEPLELLHHPKSLISNLPTEKFRAVRKEGQKIPSFIGIKAKFVPITAASMGTSTTISPGKHIEVAHDMSQIYDFTSTGEGTYTFTPSFPSFLVVSRGEKDNGLIITKLGIACVDSVAIIILSDILPASSLPPTAGLKITNSIQGGKDQVSFLQCNTSERKAIWGAASAAQAYASESYAYLQALSSHMTSPTERYDTWFGELSQWRYDTVSMHYARLKGNDFTSYTYDCSCAEPSLYAYVRPLQYGVVYLCAFWAAPSIGTDSQGGTLLHESSHFRRNGDTMDYAYGQTDSKELAADDPDSAVMNADTHEYFAENMPVMA
ncbi:hypothetical protein APHAL10511_006803 [Amanita phalloides]|nr:hypothetical protein APHAL10511_006803 [Amanita phalloides]